VASTNSGGGTEGWANTLWAASGLGQQGGQVTLECLAEGQQSTLNALVTPQYGKLSSKHSTCIYRPRGDRAGEDSFTYATKAGIAILRLMLEANRKASTRIAYVMNDALPTRQGVPMRLTVQSEREAPTLTLTDRASGSLLTCLSNESESIALANMEATAHNPNNTLKVELCDLPEGCQLTDGSHTFTATQANATADITDWQHDQLTLTPPQDSQPMFTLRVQVTETGQDAKTNEQKTFVTVAGLRVITQPVKSGKPFIQDDDLKPEEAETTSEPVTTRPDASATVTFHSSLPQNPFAPKRQGGYIILNHGPHAKPRPKPLPKSDHPIPKINWNAKPDLGDFELPDIGLTMGCFDRSKEKPKTLGELTGLVFPMERKEE
jgi:hypothetical protein